ncbi:hypothetical protein CHS0354_036577 [Potamilus streckersoni]|uniref:XK-related protein n=1 Tax=Potamilus streckersoni TaxID=2493646 RepID=A0AAE0TJ98_9BIVA|nr:hypothetical protein CHS0354_036577 [Potamilus streckersoni]
MERRQNKNDRTDMTEKVHFSIPFTNYHKDATFGKESIAMSHLKVPKEEKGFDESGSFEYRLQSGDTTHDDIKAVTRSGFPEITMHHQYASTTIHPSISYHTELEKEYDPMGPTLNVLPESYHMLNIQSNPNVRRMIDGKDSTCLLSGRSTVSNEVQDPLENMTAEAVTDQNDRSLIFYLGHTNDQVTLQTGPNNLSLTATDWTKDVMHGSMLSLLELNLLTRRHTFDQLDPSLKMRNNQVTRPRSYHGPEISNKSSSGSRVLIGSDEIKGYVRISRSGNFSAELASNLRSSNRSLTSSKFSIISSKLETPEDGQVQNQHEELEFRSTLNVCISVTFTIISILLFFADWITDINLAHTYLNDKDYTFFGVTVAFIIGPAIVCATVDLYWFYHDHLNNISGSSSQCVLRSEIQNTNEHDTLCEFRVCPKYVFSSDVENVTSSGYRKKEILTNTRNKSQNYTRDTYQNYKQDFVEENTQNASQDQYQEVEQGVYCTNLAASSHGEGQEELKLYDRANVQENTQDISLRYTSRKSQISTSNKSNNSEEDHSLSSTQKPGQPMHNMRTLVSQELKKLKREEYQKHFPDEISSENLNINTQNKSIHLHDKPVHSQCLRLNSDGKLVHSQDMRTNSDKSVHSQDKSIQSQNMRINSDDKSFHSQHKTINLQDKYIFSQDKTPVLPDIGCQMKINTLDLITTHRSACFRSSNVWVGFRIFIGILSLGRVFRSCEYIYHVIKSHQKNGPNAIYHHLRALEEKRDYKLLDLIYASTESAPQFFLQLYIFFMFNQPLMTERVLSLVASVVGISWTVVSSYMHNKAALPEGRHLTLAAQVLIFLARLCEISARMISITLFETYFNFWSLVLIIHFIIMLLWIQKQNPSLEGVAYSKHFRVLFKLFFSYVLVICFINLKCNRSKYKMVFYYVLTYGENFLFAGFVLWRCLKCRKTEEGEENLRIYWLLVIPICLILHVMFQILFYSCCHRKRRSCQ